MLRKFYGVFAALALVATACGNSNPGTLEAVIDPEGEISGFGDFTTGSEKSFGIFVCTNDGSVELTSIEPIAVSGDVVFLGAVVYTSTDRFVGAADGYPADGLDPDRLEDLSGAVVETDCEEPEGEDRVQLVLGAERTSAGGGAIEGIRVGTSTGDVDINYTILLCGDELEFCDILLQPDGT